MAPSLDILIGLWIIFLAYWVISARRVKAVAERKSRASSILYRIPVALGGVLLWAPFQRTFLSTSVTPHGALAQAVGIAVCAAGVALAIWSRRILAGNWSSDVTFKQGHELIQNGPYRFVRHPIYSAILLMCLGAAICFGQLHSWLGTASMFTGFWIKLSQEEKLLISHFGSSYSDYRRHVKALVPFIV